MYSLITVNLPEHSVNLLRNNELSGIQLNDSKTRK